MLFFGHRGARRLAPENTLAAFEAALAAGADGFECDVQRSRDGALIVFHDDTLARTTGAPGRVADATLAELRALDAGGGQRIPELSEVLTLARSAGARVLLELKSPALYPGIEAEVVAAVEAGGLAERTLYQSFDWAALERLRALRPAAELGALYPLQWPRYEPVPAGAQWLVPAGETAWLAPGKLAPARTGGRRVLVYFNTSYTDRPWLWRLVRGLGAAGLITDDPAAARRYR